VNVLVQSGVAVPKLATVGVARVSTGSLLFRVALGAIEAAARDISDGPDAPAPRIPSYEEVAGSS
jgi:2-methylisocitrate lyase-like PEP mutase family enzyme